MPSPIDPKRPMPVYSQLKELILQDIVSGVYGPGDRLPTEQELCARYEISRTPVNRAVSELAQEGVVLRRRRHGSFVNADWIPPHPPAREVHIIVPEGCWAETVRTAAPADLALRITPVGLTELRQALVSAVGEGRAPDLAIMDSVWIHEFAASGFLLPLDELDPEWVRREHDTDFVEPFRSANRYDGRLVAVQAEADVAGLWYDRDEVRAVGHEAPATWDELATLCRALAARSGATPLTVPGGARAGETAAYFLLSLLASNGATVLDREAVTLDAPAATECMAFLRMLRDEELISARSVQLERHEPIEQLAHGEAAIAFGGSYDAPALAAAAGLAKDEVLERFGFTAMPAGPRGGERTLAGGMAYAVFRQAASPHLARRILKAITTVEAMTHMSRSTWQIAPRRTSLIEAYKDSPFLRTTGTLLQQAVVRPATPPYARVSAQLQAMLEAVLTGKGEPHAVSAHAAELISAITGLPIAR